ncbi:SH3 domain-containing protein [Penicillium chermesinum]|uniref:SH3 domain-containing protein n=1 Tax=Penicillium chermesinum TaxID=63820 RepID=A0A9W9NCC1_9EURO|nr:SH3 domain-containing protein [Penicillium chermesinum]KAJ5217240.1 SH3 domain-containing protein [Penicillium chermesinum]
MLTSTKEPQGLRNPFHNPFPASLSSECRKAAKIINSFVNPSIVGDGGIPRKILSHAKVLIICTVFRVGFFGNVRFGSGIMVSRLPNGNWSAPSAIALCGVGVCSIGCELTDFVFVLSTDEAVARVMHMPSASLSLNASAALVTGRSAEYGAMLGARGLSGFYSFSKSRGIFAGLTLTFENPYANKTVYERKLKARQLVGGEVPYPKEAELLMSILNSDALRLDHRVTESTLPDKFSQAPSRQQDMELEAKSAYQEAPGDYQTPREMQGDIQGPRELLGDSHGPRELYQDPPPVRASEIDSYPNHERAAAQGNA